MHWGLFIGAGIFGMCSGVIVVTLFEAVRGYRYSFRLGYWRGRRLRGVRQEPSPIREFLNHWLIEFPLKWAYAGLSGFVGGIIGLYFGWSV